MRPFAGAEHQFRPAGRRRVVLHIDRHAGIAPPVPPRCRGRARRPSRPAARRCTAPSSTAGTAWRCPAPRSGRAAGRQVVAQRGQGLGARRPPPLRASDSGRSAAARPMTRPRKSISTRSTDRRPIFSPKKKAPSAASDIGTEGWPILPRTGSPRSSSPSSSRPRMMTETVCAERPVIRAMSDFASAPCWRTRLRTSRSLCARMPHWFDPRRPGGSTVGRVGRASSCANVPRHLLPFRTRLPGTARLRRATGGSVNNKSE